MNSFLVKVGLIALFILLLLLIKVIDDYLYFRKLRLLGEDTTHADQEKFYKAADLFAKDGSLDEIKDLLLHFIDFEDEDVEEILVLSFPHKKDKDGGYSAFIKAVNKVSGHKL